MNEMLFQITFHKNNHYRKRLKRFTSDQTMELVKKYTSGEERPEFYIRCSCPNKEIRQYTLELLNFYSSPGLRDLSVSVQINGFGLSVVLGNNYGPINQFPQAVRQDLLIEINDSKKLANIITEVEALYAKKLNIKPALINVKTTKYLQKLFSGA